MRRFAVLCLLMLAVATPVRAESVLRDGRSYTFNLHDGERLGSGAFPYRATDFTRLRCTLP